MEIFISGAGIAGLSLACLLAQSGMSVAITDPNLPDTCPDTIEHGTRTAAIMNSILPVYEQIDILDDIKSYSTPLESLRIVDTPAKHFKKPIERVFHAREINEAAFSWNVSNNYLLHTLLKKARTLDTLTLIPRDKVIGFTHHPAHITVETEKNGKYQCALLVGADGRRSFVREHASIKVNETEFNQTAITAILTHSKPHENISTEIHKPGGPFTMVPLKTEGNNHYKSSLVWIETTPDAQRISHLSKSEITANIQSLSHGYLGNIELENMIQQTSISTMKSKKITGDRIALIAEAAHTLPPTGAQGLNLSLRDITSLKEILIEGKNLGSDLGSKTTLDRYENARKHDIALRSKSTDILNQFVKQDSHFHHAVRRGAFSVLSDIPPLRETIMKKGFK